MPRPRKQTSLEVGIHQILSTAARAIAAAVRADLSEQLQRVIGNGASAAPPAAAATVKKGRRGAVTEALIDSILQIISSKPGLRSEEVQSRASASPKLVRAALAKLRAAKRVKTKGLKRAMTYSV